MKKGVCALAISPIGSFVTVVAANMFTATGGVMVPMTLEMQTIMPKWMMSIPIDCAMGQSTGTRRTAIAVPSMNVPNTSRMIATTTQNSVGLSCIADTAVTIDLESPEKVKSHENAVEVPMMNRIIADPLAEFSRIGIKSAGLISL